MASNERQPENQADFLAERYKQEEAKCPLPIAPCLKDRFDCAMDAAFAPGELVRKKRRDYFSAEWKKRRAENANFGARGVTCMMKKLLSRLPADMRLPAIQGARTEHVALNPVTPNRRPSSSTMPVYSPLVVRFGKSSDGTAREKSIPEAESKGLEAPPKTLLGSLNIERQADKAGVASVDEEEEGARCNSSAKACGNRKFDSPPRGEKICDRKQSEKDVHLQQGAPEKVKPGPGSAEHIPSAAAKVNKEQPPQIKSATAERQTGKQGAIDMIDPKAKIAKVSFVEHVGEHQAEAAAIQSQGQDCNGDPLVERRDLYDAHANQESEMTERPADSQTAARPTNQQKSGTDQIRGDQKELREVENEAREMNLSRSRHRQHDEEDDLQAELLDLAMEREEMEMERRKMENRRREAEVRRRLNMLRARKSTSLCAESEHPVPTEMLLRALGVNLAAKLP